jgi:hypothetical protein
MFVEALVLITRQSVLCRNSSHAIYRAAVVFWTANCACGDCHAQTEDGETKSYDHCWGSVEIQEIPSFYPNETDEVRREDKVGKRSIKQQYVLKGGQKIFSALKILKLFPLLLLGEVCLKEGKALGSIEWKIL